VTYVTDAERDLPHASAQLQTQKEPEMFHWERLRRLPPDIQLEVETLISDLRGETSPPFRHADEAAGRGDRGSSRHEDGGQPPRFHRLRRFW
jgi:hypothetical protein